MSYVPLVAADLAVQKPVKAVSFGLQIHLNFEDHESRIAAVEAGAGSTLLTADPGAPANDTWWVVREGTVPTEVSLKVRIGGVTYILASLTLP